MTSAATAAEEQRPDTKIPALARLIASHYGKPIHRLLVVGCGSGEEAASLSRELKCSVTGIDLISSFDRAAASAVSLETGDATALRFGDASFDFVFSFHVLEHIPDFRKALSEMNRVLCSRGGFCVGTPNRARLVGYLGSKDTTLSDKFWWNVSDWKEMMRGRFRNEFGAHAGFTSVELADALRAAFGDAIDISTCWT